MRKLLFIAGLLTGCAATNPGNEIAGTHSAPPAVDPLATERPYITPADLDLVSLLPPPPSPHSAAQRHDLQSVLATQAHRTAAMLGTATADNQQEFSRFATAVGLPLQRQSLPLTTRFVAKIVKDIAPLVKAAKECWKRPRPFVVSRQVHPPRSLLPNLNSHSAAEPAVVSHDTMSPCLPAPKRHPAFSYSYPSGHATFGATVAIILAKMVPERGAAIFARGWAFGRSRVVTGVHYPSDVEAGRYEAMALVALMLKNPQFSADYDKVRTELRTALGLQL